MSTSLLQDSFARQVEYLRISVTDRCDFRCVYCMAEDMQFLPRQQVLSLEEIETLARTFVSLGVKKIRLTGGEPLVRRGVVQLCERIAALPGLRELVMTTNGSQLTRYAKPLAQAGLKRLNISLDSLNADKFGQITRTGDLQQVLDGIDAAREAGFARIKLNAVIMKGRNDEEVLDLVDYAVARELDLTFIEEMPLGAINEHSRAEAFCSSAEVREIISQRYDLLESTESTQGPSRYWRIQGVANSRLGFISPHSHNFCATCNRVRLTAEGRLLLCLGNEHSADLKAVLRRHPGDEARLREAIFEAMARKPWSHDFRVSDDVQVVRFMNMTGG
ncbi:GTP 3',8-cyclase MoaA [Atopomonas hussainii]|uniref:GTP 3',8-cyclase MoaA n=1 Tax=Atopomonas hussainii TaxID=1429083 RepID=UPI0008FFF503|nr:GTP 3',8-cyclase MoaA [Atopomonas hussainii]